MRNLRSLPLGLLLLAACGAPSTPAPAAEAVGTQSAALAAPRVRPYEEARFQGFGAGYDPVTARSPNVDCALVDDAARCANGDCKERWSFRVDHVKTHAELLDRLGVSSGSRADFGASPGLAKTRFAAEARIDGYETAVLLSAKHFVRELSVPAEGRSLNPAYAELLATDAAQFVAACGSELPVTLTDGDETYVLLRVRHESELSRAWVEEQLAPLTRSWEIKVGKTPAEAAMERAEWQRYLLEMSVLWRHLERVVPGDGAALSRVARRAGPQEELARAPLAALRAKYEAFGDRDADAEPLILEGTFAPYASLFAEAEPHAAALDRGALETSLRAKTDAYLALEDAARATTFALDTGSLFPAMSAPAARVRLESLRAAQATALPELAACLTTAACPPTAVPSIALAREALAPQPRALVAAPNLCTGEQTCLVTPAREGQEGVAVAFDHATPDGAAGAIVRATMNASGDPAAARPVSSTAVAAGRKNYCASTWPQRSCSFADMSGDGALDLVSAGGTGGTRVFPVDASGAIGESVSFGRAVPQGESSYAQLVGDVNGDGHPDVLTFNGQGQVLASLSDGARLGAAAQWSPWFGLTGETLRLADVDGDGRADAITFLPNGRTYVGFSDTASAVQGRAVLVDRELCRAGVDLCEVADVDGDGRADAVTITRTGLVTVAAGSASGFGPSRVLTDDFCKGNEPVCTVVDVNGDGRADLVAFVKSSVAGDPAATVAGDVRVVFAPGRSTRH